MHRIAIECITRDFDRVYFVKRFVRPMPFSPSHSVGCGLAFALVASLPDGAQAATDIGRAAAIETSVTGTLDGQSIVLKSGDDIFSNQTVTTDATGVG